MGGTLVHTKYMRDTQKDREIVNLEQTKVKINSVRVFYNFFLLITLDTSYLYNLFNFNIEKENFVLNFKSRGYMVEAYFSLQNHTLKKPLGWQFHLELGQLGVINREAGWI